MRPTFDAGASARAMVRTAAIAMTAVARLLGAAAIVLHCVSIGAAALPAAEPALLPPEQAFRFSARALDARTIEVRFDVADGYYLYRDKMGLESDPATVALGKPALPAGQTHHDAFFGDTETYRGQVVARVPVAAGKAGQALVLKAASQGCADAGVCYPPTVQQVQLTLPADGAGPGPVVQAARKKGWFN